MKLLGAEEGVRRAPGSYERHYAPGTRLRLAETLSASDAGLTFDEPQNEFQITMSSLPAAYGVSMYAALHGLDALGVPEIVVQSPPSTRGWEAVWDRLKRAATA